MATQHRLTATVTPGGILFACEDDLCGRRLVIDRETGEMVVIDHGDRAARHSGAAGGVRLHDPRIAIR
ncbi:hypothetical protein KOI35_15700 [Actinoplanes bogorensis]|uniref:Uncharacterized protein n=1 Tax=Paractinoplanes bogorensis TaxID=1610840 RepID=A0ABS5YNA7_9ACTN|nr:hypothetical protein [Actinoplanes bogorensis]MBU2664947.1 hypothetical protein [Actinoplanes bogorensis]